MSSASTPSEAMRKSGLAAHEAERLLLIATGWTRTDLSRADELTTEATGRFADLVAARRSGIPLQHLEGTVQFGPLELRCDGRALVPRPETEELWEFVSSIIASPRAIVDLCTGGGCLALALKHSFGDARVVGVDLSAEALALARENAAFTDLDVEFVHGDLFSPLPTDLRGQVDVLVSNPPYLAEHEMSGLAVEVAVHDPTMALVAGPSGDEVLTRLAADAATWLRPGGVLAVEIGAGQGARATEIFAEFAPVIRADIQGRDRFVVGHAVE